MRPLFLALLFAFSLGETGCVRAANSLADATIVVYNRAAPDSAGLARFYAAQRRIPNDHLVGLDCSTEEEISRQEYDQTIAAPLRKIFRERQWWIQRGDNEVTATQIRFVALIRGIPLKIRATTAYPGDEAGSNPVNSLNQASVDSELSVLGFFAKQISGAMNNPYFQSFRSAVDLESSPVLLVCRLDGPSAEIVRRMINDAIETEKTGLWGRAYVDGAHNTGGGLADGDLWLQAVVKDLRRVGIPVVYDEKPATFPAGFPMSDCVLYYGWYAGNVSGPFTDPGFAFRRGAIAVHIHSFSAASVRYPDAHWVGPLLSKGAAASLGNVYEPYLQMTAHLDILNDRLLHGFTLAESAYMATRALSWMNVVVGDPLYRPYLSWMQLDAKPSSKNNWQAYHDLATKNSGKPPAEYLTLARRAASRSDNGPMIEDLGLIQKEGHDFAGAISYLQQARTIYKQRGDLLRVVLEQADALIESGQKKEALALLHGASRVVSDAPSSALVRKKEEELNPPTPTPPRAAVSPTPTQ